MAQPESRAAISLRRMRSRVSPPGCGSRCPSSRCVQVTVDVKRAHASRLLAGLPRSGLSVLITDPPYDTVNRHGGSYLKRWFRGTMTWQQIGAVLATARRRMKADGVAMVIVNEAGLGAAQGAVRRAGFPRQRLIVWDKQSPGLGSGLRHQVGYVVVGLLPGSRALTGRDLVSVPVVASRTRGRYPTEKPVELGRRLAFIAGISRRDIVVDPFAGSASLLVGALERGAYVVAGDTSARAVALAKARLAAAAAKRRRPSLDSPQISGTRTPTKPKKRRLTRRRAGR